MNTNTAEKQKLLSELPDAANSDYNSLEAVESVYTDDTVDTIELISAPPVKTVQMNFDTTQQAANDAVCDADVFAMNSARRSKLDKSVERRASKSRLTDRREESRMDASGEQQSDRREVK